MKKNINISRLPGGLCVLSDKMSGVRSATIGFFFRVGSRHEPNDLNGISHFIEHTVFKGSSKRSPLEIAIEQDRLGGNLDAFTTHEETGFAIKVIDDQIPRAFDLIADMLVNPRFEEKDLESEQRVIIEEMKMLEDSPEEYLGEIFSKGFFPGHPLGLSIAGTPETVRTFDAAVTRDYHRRAFQGANLVIAAAGNVDHGRLVDLAASAWPSDGSATLTPLWEPPKYVAPIIVEQNNNLEQAHMLIALPFVAAVDQSRYAADLLSNIIGGGTSSRLWQKVREERGLAYSVGASTIMYRDCGIFTISAGTSPEQVGEVVEIAVAELKAVNERGVTADELELSKQQTRASILLGLEDSADRAATLAQSEMLHGRQIPVEETLAMVDAVTVQELQALANEYFKTEHVAFTALGDLGDLKIDRSDLAVS